jgi:drug/metabolite transporter (DMT)-like permease
MDGPPGPPRAPLPALAAAFAGLYLVWGSTFLGIKIAVETLPPLLMAGVRFFAAGLLLYAWLRARGAAAPTAAQWRAALADGALLLLLGNGLVTWAQQQGAPSGVAALFIAATPAWMVVAGWLLGGEARPGLLVLAGMALGFAGVTLLIKPDSGGGPVPWWAYAALLAAPMFWSVGSVWSRRAARPRSPLLTSAMQMLTGGGLMLLAGVLLGEGATLAARPPSLRSALACAYLALVGALVGFSLYTWLLRHASTAALSTYAYVNPLIAVFLGWAVGGEEVGANLLLAAASILGAVVLITLGRPAPPTRPAEPPPEAVEPLGPQRAPAPTGVLPETR